jgi:hypothetical protein
MAQDADLAQLQAALAQDWDSLLIELGTYGIDVSPRDPLRKGMRIYDALCAKLRQDICTNDGIRILLEDRADELALAGALADLVAALSHHVPTATVAALLIKTGLPAYCADYWA